MIHHYAEPLIYLLSLNREPHPRYAVLLRDLPFSQGALNYLGFNGIITLSDLIVLPERYLKSMPGFGRKRLENVKEVLANRGLYLGMNPDDIFISRSPSTG